MFDLTSSADELKVMIDNEDYSIFDQIEEREACVLSFLFCSPCVIFSGLVFVGQHGLATIEVFVLEKRESGRGFVCCDSLGLSPELRSSG